LSIAQKQNPQAFQAWSPYFLSRYKKYHGNTDDWNQRMATAATETAPPPNFVASIPLAPTPCDLAAQAVQQNDPSQLSFSDYELVLSCRDKTPANKEAADKVWQFIQAKEKNGEAKLKMPVKVIAVPDPNTLEVAMSDDNQAANKADMRVTMEKPMTKPPAPGTNTDVIGVISEYTPDPFMFTMRPACGFITTNQHSAETWITLGGFKTSREPGKEALQDLLFLHANHAVIGAGHSNVSLISRAARQDPSICGGDVGMRSQHGRDASIQVPAKRDFL
jgi:hypothetical protein